jgi:S-adenosylmethionine decarboxylase
MHKSPLKTIKRYFLYLVLLPFFSFADSSNEEHLFTGKHFLASYLDCDATALSNVDGLLFAMEQAIRATGANILNRTIHVFDTSGCTAVYLLSESHASIHTYPEFGSCFVDLFTCGDNYFSRPFDQRLREYLQPKTVNARQFLRHTSIEEDLPNP